MVIPCDRQLSAQQVCFDGILLDASLDRGVLHDIKWERSRRFMWLHCSFAAKYFGNRSRDCLPYLVDTERSVEGLGSEDAGDHSS
jgi:hypothetical protein